MNSKHDFRLLCRGPSIFEIQHLELDGRQCVRLIVARNLKASHPENPGAVEAVRVSLILWVSEPRAAVVVEPVRLLVWRDAAA